MNAQLLNPFAGTVPERVEATLENAYANCFAFNAGKGVLAGSYIAAGRTDGIVSVWDLETRNVLCWMGEHVKTVTSVRYAAEHRGPGLTGSWSPYGRYLASSSLDWNVHIWDLANNVYRRARTLRFDCPVSQVIFSPQTSRLLAVVLESRQALLVQFPTPEQLDPERGTEPRVIPLGDAFEDVCTAKDASISATTCCFTPDGAFLLVGTSKGSIHMFDAHTGKENGASVPIGSSSVRQLAFDAAGRCVVVNLNDRTLRTYLVLRDDPQVSISLSPQHKFQDLVSRTPWSGVSFSGDSDYVMGGAAQATAHNVYVWDRESGVLFKILEGPREPLVSAQWHPSKPMLASIASSGDIYLWSAPSTEVWSAYAPGFEELEENVEYDEPEDEFDFEDVDALSRKKEDEEGGFVDIFSTGPESYTAAAKSTAPPIVRRHTSNLAPASDTQDASITEDRLRDDDDQPAFFIQPELEELEEQP